MSTWNDPYKHLIAAVILAAVKDAAQGDVAARGWLLSEAAQWYCATVNLNHEALLSWVGRGCKIERRRVA